MLHDREHALAISKLEEWVRPLDDEHTWQFPDREALLRAILALQYCHRLGLLYEEQPQITRVPFCSMEWKAKKYQIGKHVELIIYKKDDGSFCFNTGIKARFSVFDFESGWPRISEVLREILCAQDLMEEPEKLWKRDDNPRKKSKSK